MNCAGGTPRPSGTPPLKKGKGLIISLATKNLLKKEKLKHFKTKEASNAAKQKKLTRKLITRF